MSTQIRKTTKGETLSLWREASQVQPEIPRTRINIDPAETTLHVVEQSGGSLLLKITPELLRDHDLPADSSLQGWNCLVTNTDGQHIGGVIEGVSTTKTPISLECDEYTVM